MDVVRANILKIGGSIEVSSTPQDGTTFYLKLPLTLSMMSALTVEARGQIFALPRTFVDEIAFARAHHLPIVAVDNVPGSVPVDAAPLPHACILLFGQEGPGLSEAALAAAEPDSDTTS